MNGDPLEGCEEDFLLGLLDSLGDLETWVDESAADGVYPGARGEHKKHILQQYQVQGLENSLH